MELHLALKNIVNLSGTDILKEQRLLNILADFNAYDDVPSTKFIIKTIIDEGYMEKFLANGKWDLNCDKLIDQFVAMTGMQRDNVTYAFECLGFGLGWNNLIKHQTSVRMTLPNQILSSKKLDINDYLQNITETKYGNHSGFVLQNPTAYSTGKKKLVIGCEIVGAFKEGGTSFLKVKSAIYCKNSIVKNVNFDIIWNFNFSGFEIVTKEVVIPIPHNDISKIVFYMGN